MGPVSPNFKAGFVNRASRGANHHKRIDRLFRNKLIVNYFAGWCYWLLENFESAKSRHRSGKVPRVFAQNSEFREPPRRADTALKKPGVIFRPQLLPECSPSRSAPKESR